MFLPILNSRCVSLIKDDSAESCVMQSKILKIFKSLIQVRRTNEVFLYIDYAESQQSSCLQLQVTNESNFHHVAHHVII